MLEALAGGIPSTLFGVFFEEINHAGGGGLWAELVSNRGFESGGQNTPSNIAPWYAIGDESQVWLESERSSCFERNPVALRMEVVREVEGGVGIANPGFWGMDIRAGNTYKVSLWVRSLDKVNLSIAFTSRNGTTTLAQSDLTLDASEAEEWSKHEMVLEAFDTDHYARLALTSMHKGVLWLDQVSAMPEETYKGHGFRKELALMLEDLKPGFVRFPGGCYVEGGSLRNAWRWRDTVGPWEERPGHFGDKWNYWSDDGLGFFELLQLSEDLEALPVWVFNNGISHSDEVLPELLDPFIQDILDGIEFARGPMTSKWGRVREAMGHPEPFPLFYMAIGNEDCERQYYHANYLKFYYAIKEAYPDIHLISNCDGTLKPLGHPADLFDFHIYTSANTLFSMVHKFNHVSRDGPKVFVSEYAVVKSDAGQGSFLAALAEAAFLIGIELNSDIVGMASYAPLFVNTNNRRWNPDAIVFDSWQQYGTPSYWMQHFFKMSNGAKLLPFVVESLNTSAVPVVLSAVRIEDGTSLVLKAVNYGQFPVEIRVSLEGVLSNEIDIFASTITVLSSESLMDENSFQNPHKVVPITSLFLSAATDMELSLPPYSIVALGLPLLSSSRADI
ncbi:hypothetical protein SELMODRAFT_269745 [Selaginella moellendorffii]|uniref:non-reducing end alpha-L-arabinofuranosidase n=1 Tax=Selaginella moellendorffii TaxID=88036 RepID=D8T641_SELML|nr:hypothetical protein SELMODRAFT_269745 [Selaginella moellendorffii]